MIYNSPYPVENPTKTLNELKDKKGVIIFGTGNCGQITLTALKDLKINVLAMSDNNMHRWGKKIGVDKKWVPKKMGVEKDGFPCCLSRTDKTSVD